MANLLDVSSEPWFTEDCTSQYALAYQAGRLLKCLDYLLLHRFPRSEMPRYEDVLAVQARLTEISQRDDLIGNNDSIRWTVERTVRRWYEGVTMSVWASADEDPSTIWLGSWCGSPSWSDDIRREFCKALDPNGVLWLTLGYHLDPVIRSDRRTFYRMPSLVKPEPDRFEAWNEFLRDGVITKPFAELGLSFDPFPNTARTVPEEVVWLDQSIRQQLGTFRARAVGVENRDGGSESVQPEVSVPAMPVTAAPAPNPSSPPNAPSQRELQRLNALKNKIDPDGKYVGQSLAILRLFDKIAELNQMPNEPVLILGESGVGKTELAELIHTHSGRKRELGTDQGSNTCNSDFGIVRERWLGFLKGSSVSGAARNGQEGLLQQCAGGTIFVDELHDASKKFQSFLLQVLDRREIQRPHGPLGPLKPDVRLIFASNKSLAYLEETLRLDLLDRIRRQRVEVPPLRDRTEDIVLFLNTWHEGRKVDERVWLALFRYHWPGNVRELKDVLKIAVIKAGRGSNRRLLLEHLQLEDPSVIEAVKELSPDEAKREFFSFIVQALRLQGFRRGQGLQKRLAELLGCSEPTISRKYGRHLRALEGSPDSSPQREAMEP